MIPKGTWMIESSNSGTKHYIIDKDIYKTCKKCGADKKMDEFKLCKSCYRDEKINQILE